MLRIVFVRFLIVMTLVLPALIVLQPTASAEDAPRFKRLKVSIWPEYDAASVLVMYQSDLADDVPLPATVRYALPQGARVHAAAEIDATGRYLDIKPQVFEGDNPGASYSFNQRSTQFEFYLQPIEGAGRRDITYTVRAPGPADVLQVEVQRPLRATDFALSPAASTVFSDSNGFEYSSLDYSNVTAGQEIALRISYEKPDALPSVQPQQNAGPVGLDNQYAVVFVALGLAMLLLGVFFYLRGRRRPAPAVAVAAARRKNGKRQPTTVAARPVASRAAPIAAGGDNRYCTQCGSRVRAEAVFCTACGRPLKLRT